MTLPEFVLEPLNVAGAQLRFFATVEPDGVQVAAAVLTWQSMRDANLETFGRSCGPVQVSLSEDEWYSRAQQVFNDHRSSLKTTGLSAGVVARLCSDYFFSYPHAEVESWLAMVAGRNGYATQAASLH